MDSVGFSYWDYLTGGSSKHNIINFGDGTCSIVRTASIDSEPYPARATYTGPTMTEQNH